MAGGDDTALRELLSRHEPWLAARLRTGLPAADVEDVLQETPQPSALPGSRPTPPVWASRAWKLSHTCLI